MHIFNIIGPRMIGPSSSHTAGAVRLGRVAYKVMNGSIPQYVRIEMSGSFAETYQGHGTDKALIAGVLGYNSDDEEIRNIFEIAKKQQLTFDFVPVTIPGAHPNTARIYFTCRDGYEGMVEGASIGGGNIRITSINGLAVNFTAENTTLLVLHEDKPGVIANVTGWISDRYVEANICNFSLSRHEKGGEAMMTIELDNPLPAGMKDEIKKLDKVINVIGIQPI